MSSSAPVSLPSGPRGAADNRTSCMPSSSSPPVATFTTNIRPSSVSGLPSSRDVGGIAASTRPTAGPSISTRTSFTRVETEDEHARQLPFPARPATASAAPSSSSSPGAFGLGFGLGMFGSRYGERLTDVVSTGGSAEGDSNEHDDHQDVQEHERAQDDNNKSLAVRPPSPSHSTTASTSAKQDQQPTAADSAAAAAAAAAAPTPAQVPESHASVQPPAVLQDPQAYITFLLVTGCRRTMSFEPETTVGRVKELVWNTWPEDDEWRKDRPPAPSFLRLLYLGRLLQDDDTLTKLRIPISYPTYPQPTIVHLSIRPYPPVQNAESLNKKMRRLRSLSSGDDDADDHLNCCRCIIC